MQMTLQEPIALLRELFRAPAHGSPSPEALERALRLCSCLRREADDAEYRSQVDALSDYAVRLFSGDEPWRHGESPGPQALRLRALKVLSQCERRLTDPM